LDFITLPVESHVLRFLLGNQEEEHYFLSEADPFGMYLLRLLIENPRERRRDEPVAAYPGRWPVQLGSYAAWGIGEPSSKVAYLFNSYINKFMLRDLHAFVQQAVENGEQAKHAIQGFMAKYGLREEDIQFETLQKSWQRYWSHRKASKKKRASLNGQLPLKELEKRLLKTSQPVAQVSAQAA
jgi:hypothetical protein